MRPGPDSESDLEEMLDYLRAALAQGPPAGSLLAGLVGARRCGVLGEDELLSNAMLLLIAGLETTTHFLGNAMVALLSHRDQWELLLERPDLLPPAIEELLRFDNSVQVALRVPCEALPVSGAVLPKGALVVCVIGAANRDPEMFERPDALWIERPCVRHLSFGFGAHFCLGAELARLEARQALGALLRRFPRLRLEGAVRFRPNPIMRGPLSLSVAP
jgi:cytochrome P450